MPGVFFLVLERKSNFSRYTSQYEGGENLVEVIAHRPQLFTVSFVRIGEL